MSGGALHDESDTEWQHVKRGSVHSASSGEAGYDSQDDKSLLARGKMPDVPPPKPKATNPAVARLQARLATKTQVPAHSIVPSTPVPQEKQPSQPAAAAAAAPTSLSPSSLQASTSAQNAAAEQATGSAQSHPSSDDATDSAAEGSTSPSKALADPATQKKAVHLLLGLLDADDKAGLKATGVYASPEKAYGPAADTTAAIPKQEQGGGWGWTASLRNLAAGAVRDVYELSDTLQQAILEVVHDDPVPASQSDSHMASGSSPTRPSAPRGHTHEQPPGGSTLDPQIHPVLERLRGQPTALEAGLKVLDNKVEAAMEGLWGGLRGALAAGSAAASAAVREARKLAQQLEKLPQQLLDGDATGASIAKAVRVRDAMTFDACFFAYGGRQAMEELEALADDCARSCKRLRSQLDPESRAAFDAALSSLSPYFDLQVDLPTESEDDNGTLHLGSAEENPLGDGHDHIAELCTSGAEEASSYGRLCRSKADLTRLRKEALQRCAEGAVLCVERLLELSRSLTTSRQYGRSDDGIEWPDAPEGTAALLRVEAQRMLAVLRHLASAFMIAVKAAGEQVQARAKGGPSRPQASPVKGSIPGPGDGDGAAPASTSEIQPEGEALGSPEQSSSGAGERATPQDEGNLHAQAAMLAAEVDALAVTVSARVADAFRGLLMITLLSGQDTDELTHS